MYFTTVIHPKDIICPISHQIFYEPVVADDGIAYEADELRTWMKISTVSPVTGKHITNFVPSILLKNIVEKFLEANPDQIKNRYKPSRNHVDYTDEVEDIMAKHNYDELFYYKNFQLEKFYGNGHMVKLLEKNNVDLIKYIIDNSFDLDVPSDSGVRLIHYVLEHSTYQIQKYLIDLDIDLEAEDNERWRPIHYACMYGSTKIIKNLVDLGVELDVENDDGCRPIHYICENHDPAMIKYFIKNNINLEAQNCSYWRPIHYVCKYSTIDVIKCFLKRKIATDLPTDNGSLPVTLIPLNENLTKQEKIELLKILLD